LEALSGEVLGIDGLEVAVDGFTPAIPRRGDPAVDCGDPLELLVGGQGASRRRSPTRRASSSGPRSGPPRSVGWQARSGTPPAVPPAPVPARWHREAPPFIASAAPWRATLTTSSRGMAKTELVTAVSM
jgi:hypothetical protein